MVPGQGASVGMPLKKEILRPVKSLAPLMFLTRRVRAYLKKISADFAVQKFFQLFWQTAKNFGIIGE